MKLFLALALGLVRVLPDLIDLFKQVGKVEPEQVSLKSKSVFRKLGDAKNEKQRIEALRDIQRLTKRV